MVACAAVNVPVCQALEAPKPRINWLVVPASIVAVPAQEGAVIPQLRNKPKNEILKNLRIIKKTFPFRRKRPRYLKSSALEPQRSQTLNHFSFSSKNVFNKPAPFRNRSRG